MVKDRNRYTGIRWPTDHKHNLLEQSCRILNAKGRNPVGELVGN